MSSGFDNLIKKASCLNECGIVHSHPSKTLVITILNFKEYSECVADDKHFIFSKNKMELLTKGDNLIPFVIKVDRNHRLPHDSLGEFDVKISVLSDYISKADEFLFATDFFECASHRLRKYENDLLNSDVILDSKNKKRL